MTELARKANVMFVDDEKRVLSSMRALFRRDYNVHLATSGDEALELLERQQMDVIVSDQRMPGMTGVDVLKACKLRAPRAMRILLTGYADKEAIAASINEGEVFRYLTKPCPRETLEKTLALAVRAAGLAVPPANSTAPRDAGSYVPRSPAPPRAQPRKVRLQPPRPQHSDPGTSGGARHGMAASGSAAKRSAVDLLVLSSDRPFTAALEKALATTHRLHSVRDVQKALEVLDSHPIGVVITDMAVNADEVQALTTELKRAAPELVTIVASDHSDAHRLIELINSGQVFRFLLKPIKPKQTAIWIESAVNKHLELVKNPVLAARHVVAPPPPLLRELGDKLIRNVTGRLLRLRSLAGFGTERKREDS